MVLLVALSGCQKKSESAVKGNENATLIMASDHGDLSRVQQLLREGANVNEQTKSGKTALHYAAQSKNVLVVQALIQAGADVNAKMTGDVTPLMLSVDMAFGQPDIALALIQAGADVNAADENGDTALIIATTESSFEVFQSLLDRGANPNARGLNGATALDYAAMNAMLDRAKLLLEHGADPTILNSAGRVPFDDAKTAEMRNLLSQVSIKPNVWEFVRNKNGSYAVFKNGKLLSDAIPEQRREDEFCIRFGFCGHEYEEIVRQLRQSGKCTLNL